MPHRISALDDALAYIDGHDGVWKATGNEIIKHFAKGDFLTIEAFKPIWALGLMSGTSIDGIDVALIETDGEQVFDIGPANTIPYSASLERSIRASLGQRKVDATLINDITHAHATATKTLLSRYPEYKEKLTVVGLHGHTVFHAPDEGTNRPSWKWYELSETNWL